MSIVGWNQREKSKLEWMNWIRKKKEKSLSLMRIEHANRIPLSSLSVNVKTKSVTKKKRLNPTRSKGQKVNCQLPTLLSQVPPPKNSKEYSPTEIVKY